MWTPYQIEILLHHHCSTARFSRADAPAFNEALGSLQEAGLLNSERRTTDMGVAFLEMLLSTPLPVMSWSDPRFVAKAAGVPVKEA